MKVRQWTGRNNILQHQLGFYAKAKMAAMTNEVLTASNYQTKNPNKTSPELLSIVSIDCRTIDMTGGSPVTCADNYAIIYNDNQHNYSRPTTDLHK